MARTKFTNVHMKYSYQNLEHQLHNVEAAIHKHAPGSPEAIHLIGERQRLIQRLEAME
jgi:hypothetical protein